ncbi:MAG TPA: DNA mismatch repair endonuclease MutL [Candidatus Eisenbacteria bacterium]|nr:DNA mismatch repair endonuclease MutL [Candidatus Eisenbacteria bacterium]
MKIHVLPDALASRIAAGEVVERPASVVKELMENALDAGATEISVALEKNGAALIRISDNGEGMAADDLLVAIERHSTSKLRDESDLFRIATLGFRGEALPSIAAVSRVDIISRSASDASGHRLRVEGGRRQELAPVACAVGTTVTVRDLFFNTPARLKFLKSPATELSHICDVFNRLALARPDVHFRLLHDGRMLADYVAARDSGERLRQVFGRELAEKLIAFSLRRDALSISGHASTAPLSFPNARYLQTFVNGRYVRDRVINHAVLSGYETLLMRGRYPAAVLFLELPAGEVDVNVHPAKYEVRFRRQPVVYDAVVAALREALRAGPRRSRAEIAVERAAGTDAVMEPSLPYGAAALAHRLPAASALTMPAPAGEAATMQAAAATSDAAVTGFFSSLKVLGQIFGCYLVCASSRGLAIIDQHAAHERVVFEHLKAQLARGAVQKQSLLVPQILELPAGEENLLEGRLESLERFGFSVEPFGPSGYAVTAAPALLPEGDYREIVRRMVAEIAEIDGSHAARVTLEERLATIACHGVIRAHRKLEAAEMQALLEALDRIDFATQCPHGRPLLVEFTGPDLERLFKRV